MLPSINLAGPCVTNLSILISALTLCPGIWIYVQELRGIQASFQLLPLTQSSSGIHSYHMISGAAEQAFTPKALQPQAQPPSLPRRVDPAEVTEAKGHEHKRAPDESAAQHDADLIDLIKGYLQDPAFQEEVERVAQLWDRAEEELLAEHAAAGMDLETETNFSSEEP